MEQGLFNSKNIFFSFLKLYLNDQINNMYSSSKMKFLEKDSLVPLLMQSTVVSLFEAFQCSTKFFSQILKPPKISKNNVTILEPERGCSNNLKPIIHFCKIQFSLIKCTTIPIYPRH